MGYIDCHCHLTAKEFDKDRSEVIEHAKKNNVESIIVVTEFASEFNPTCRCVQNTLDFCMLAWVSILYNQ